MDLFLASWLPYPCIYLQSSQQQNQHTMVRLSNASIGMLNFCSLVTGIGAIAIGLYFYVYGGNHCRKILQNPLLLMGLFIFVFSLLGLMGSCCGINFLLNLYLFVLVLMILGLVALTGFVFSVTHEGGGRDVQGTGFKEYRVQDYSDWLQKHFADGKTWTQIRSCLVDARVCSSLSQNVEPAEVSQFYKMKMSPVQSGCCKPPISCGFEYKNPTFWTVPGSGLKEEGHDCSSWSNHQDTLCYDCFSCKGGVLAFIKKEWTFFAYFNIALLVVFNLILSIACCARRNNVEDQGYRRYI